MSKLKRENKKHNIYTHINISRTHCSHYFTKTTLAGAPMTFYAQVQWLLSALYLCSCRTGFCFWIPSFREESTALASSVLSSLMLLLSSLFAFRVLTRVSLTTHLLIAWLWPSSLLSEQTLHGWLQWCPHSHGFNYHLSPDNYQNLYFHLKLPFLSATSSYTTICRWSPTRLQKQHVQSHILQNASSSCCTVLIGGSRVFPKACEINLEFNSYGSLHKHQQ